jgi:hypothetical protein
MIQRAYGNGFQHCQKCAMSIFDRDKTPLRMLIDDGIGASKLQFNSAKNPNFLIKKSISKDSVK